MILKKYLAIIVLSITATIGCTRDKALTINNKMVVYPNPFIDKFYVNVNLPKAEDFTVKVYNVDGVLMKEITVNNGQVNNNLSVDATGQKDGIMYVLVELPSGNLSQKILKVKP